MQRREIPKRVKCWCLICDMHMAGTKGKERICPWFKRKNVFKMSKKYKVKINDIESD